MYTEELFNFINNSHSVFHTVNYIKNILLDNGYICLNEDSVWEIKENSNYFVIRDSSSIIVFKTGANIKKLNIVASHDDSPTYKLKPHADFNTRLSVERYGGVVDNSWMDKPVSIAGRVFIKSNKGLKEELIDFSDKTFVIPRVAPHLNPDYSKIMIEDMLPLFSENGLNILGEIQKRLKFQDNEKILSHDLFLYSKDIPTFNGINNEYISSPKLDDLECAYSSLVSIMDSIPNESINMCMIFNNEEVGSLSINGASSTFAKDVTERILNSLKLDKYTIYAKSFIVSADNAHAMHPAKPNLSDHTDYPVMNQGVVIKSAASLSYTTDALSSAILEDIFIDNNIKFQYYTNNGNIRGGSTLGRLLLEQLSINTCDIGLAQLAMHSSYEMAGTYDLEYLIKGLKAFYNR